MDNTRLFLVEDERLFADVLAAAFQDIPDMRVVGYGTAADPDLTTTLRGQRPDVVTVEVAHVAGPLTEQVGDWQRAAPNATFIALTSSCDADLAVEAVRAGIDMWIPKESSTKTVLELLRAAKTGYGWYPPEQLAVVFSRLRRAEVQHGRPLDVLSERETEVMRAMVDGAGGPAIAAKMGLSRHTVRTHLRNIFKKLDVHSGLELVKLARAAGIEPEPSRDFPALPLRARHLSPVRAIHHDTKGKGQPA